MDTTVYSGTVSHQLDDKGRVRIPSKFFPKSDDKTEDDKRDFTMKFYFMAGSQGCISVYLPEALDRRIDSMRNVTNSTEDTVRAKRKILASIESVVTDKQGRTVIPPSLRNYAKIGKELISVGADDHFEIWAKDEYEKQDGIMSYERAYSEVGFF